MSYVSRYIHTRPVALSVRHCHMSPHEAVGSNHEGIGQKFGLGYKMLVDMGEGKLTSNATFTVV